MVHGPVLLLVFQLNLPLQQGRPVQRLWGMFPSNAHTEGPPYVYFLQHYVVSYYTGETYDCGQSNCKLSSAHMHKSEAKTCLMQHGLHLHTCMITRHIYLVLPPDRLGGNNVKSRICSNSNVMTAKLRTRLHEGPSLIDAWVETGSVYSSIDVALSASTLQIVL